MPTVLLRLASRRAAEHPRVPRLRERLASQFLAWLLVTAGVVGGTAMQVGGLVERGIHALRRR
jgi:hypothetical protein